ncbi:MAG: tRNA (N6-isopentenyl adenosine(37)-C2)-methylthiotransferase MiaB [Chitinivibrionales bacterium]
MKTFHIETFGCQMNVADSARLSSVLASRGLNQVQPEKAELLIINTCSVRERAELRAEARIREYSALKRKRGGELWVVGCMAERLKQEIKDKYRDVDRVIGAVDMESVEEHIDSLFKTKDPGEGNPLYTSVSEFLPVMRGCNNFCTYCIVPYVRGREHSVPWRSVVKEAERLSELGVKEITLLGQNVNSYRSEELNFSELIRRVSEVPGILRIRFTTSHPKDISDELIDTVSNTEKVCKHIHLPVQSGSDRILSDMGRGYTAGKYMDTITKIKQKIPGADITTDVMVGFPGETERDFLKTIELFKEVKFTYSYMFAYSKREGTRAYTMEESLTREEKKQRLSELITLQNRITKEHYNSMVGEIIKPLFTASQKDRGLIGQDMGFKRVLTYSVEDPEEAPGLFRVESSSGMTLLSEPL